MCHPVVFTLILCGVLVLDGTQCQSSDTILDTILQSLADQQTEITNLKRTNDELKADFAQEMNDQQTEIANMKRDNVELKTEFTREMNEQRASMNRENDLLKRKLAEQDIEICKMKEVLLETNLTSGRKTDAVKQLEKRLLVDSSIVLPNQTVAFSARMSTNQGNLGNEQTIVFGTVITNIENVYSPISGMFTAPSAGTYFFTATIMCENTDYVEAEIVKNGQQLIYIYAADSTRNEQGSGAVTLQLEKGDLVYVRHHNTQGDTVHTWSSFTGFRISN